MSRDYAYRQADMSNQLNKYSARLTQDPSQVGSRAMLFGAGLTEEDLDKPRIALPARAICTSTDSPLK